MDFFVSPYRGQQTGSLIYWGIAVDPGGTSVVEKGSRSVLSQRFCGVRTVPDNGLCCGTSPGKRRSGIDGGTFL